MNSYSREYFECGGGSHYMGYEDGPLHETRAKAIAKFKPKNVLEIGCAKGFTVKHLREMGVDAYGVDISHYAVEQADNPAITLHDITKKFPFKDGEFDWVISWDVLEHIPLESIPFVISELQRVGKNNFHRIATESDEDDADTTHVSIYPIEWWRERFTNSLLQGSNDPDL